MNDLNCERVLHGNTFGETMALNDDGQGSMSVRLFSHGAPATGADLDRSDAVWLIVALTEFATAGLSLEHPYESELPE